MLGQDQAVVLEPCGPHQKRVGAGTAGEAGRLRVEEQELPHILEGRLQPRQHAEEIQRRTEGARERLAPVPVRERELTAHHHELPLAGVDQLAAENLLDRRRGGTREPARLDAPDDAAEIVERLVSHGISVGEGAQQRSRRRLGPAPDLVDGADARGTADLAGARFEGVEPAT